MRIYDSIISSQPINKGWSCDEKYFVTTTDNSKYLLRITPALKAQARKSGFLILQELEKLDISMCKPIECGDCSEGIYTLHTWVNGNDLSDVLPTLSKSEQYSLGLKAGKYLNKIHSIPAPKEQESWTVYYNRKVNNNIKKNLECGLHFEGEQSFFQYLENNRHLLENRPQCIQHGDYHNGNMMLENNKLVIIDFDRLSFGDPWEEFNRIVWCAQASPYFATGIVNKYFNGPPPSEFWQLLAFYLSSNTLGSIAWAIPFGQDEINVMVAQAHDVLQWYDDMKRLVPSWYINDAVINYSTNY